MCTSDPLPPSDELWRAIVMAASTALPQEAASCPSSDEIGGFIDGRLFAEEATPVIEHIVVCPPCARLVAQGVAELRDEEALKAPREPHLVLERALLRMQGNTQNC